MEARNKFGPLSTPLTNFKSERFELECIRNWENRMKKSIIVAAAMLATVCSAHADDNVFSFFRSEPAPIHRDGGTIVRPDFQAKYEGAAPRRHTNLGGVQGQIADHVTRTIGAQWISTSLRIAKIESGFRCNARNHRAVGIFQNTNPQMFGVSRSAALTCSGGIRAGVAHMAMCIRKGARNSHQMMVCHNTGSPFSRRVERAYRFALHLGTRRA
jgi:hypothetical protein